MKRYRVFSRSARNFEEFATATKSTVALGVTYEEARRLCAEYNNNRTPEQIERGTKLEFEEV